MAITRILLFMLRSQLKRHSVNLGGSEVAPLNFDASFWFFHQVENIESVRNRDGLRGLGIDAGSLQ